jgi:hypothetical protein
VRDHIQPKNQKRGPHGRGVGLHKKRIEKFINEKKFEHSAKNQT